MIDIPVIRPDLSIARSGGAGVLLGSARERHWLSGALFERVIAAIDGSRTSREIVARLASEWRAEEVYYALATLEKQGLVVEPEAAASADAAWWFGLGVDPRRARERLAASAVEIVASRNLDASLLAGVLDELGVLLLGLPMVRVVIAGTLDSDEPCRTSHQDSLRSGVPWMLVCPEAGWIGPLFVPGETGCWECLRARLILNGCRPARAAFPRQLILHAAALQLALWIAGARTEIAGAILVLDPARLTHTRHVLSRLPQCPSCGGAGNIDTAGVSLESRPKRFVSDGGHRVCTPAETRLALERHVSEVTGLVRDLGRAEHDGLVHVFTAAYVRHHGGTGEAAGKGVTQDQAWCSCVAEALERHSSCWRGDEPVVRAPWRDMAACAVHPDTLTLFSDRQAERERFDETQPVDWIAARSLVSGEVRYLPAAYGLMAYPNAAWCRGDTNGCAGGNTIEEAILQGFLELVERDAVAIWWYNQLRRPGVDIASFDEPAFALLRRELGSLGRSLHVLDVTSDLGVPCMAAVSIMENGSGVVLGFGAHFDPGIAASRALTELKQLLPSASAPFARAGDREWMEQVTDRNQPCVLPAEGPLREARHFTSVAHGDLRDDVRHCAEIARSRGMDMLVLNLTRAEIGFPVVRVTVPGMRHFWPRFAPGRLYQVPVRMGWLDAPLTEEQLNPLRIRS